MLTQAAFQAFRPDTRPEKFAGWTSFRIRDILAFARKLTKLDPTEQQIIQLCFKVKLISRSPDRLEHLSETELERIWRWFAQQVFANGFDSYFAERYH